MNCRVFVTALCFLVVLPVILMACKDFPNPFAKEKEVIEALRFRYSINFVATGALAKKSPKRGAVGFLHLQTTPTDNAIAVGGRVSTDVDIAIGAQGGTHKVNRDYTSQQKPPVYNMLTLPLYLRHLAITHQQTIVAVNTLLKEMTQLERQLLTAGKATYPSFARLNVINSGDYSFGGLNKRSRVTFAGKQFSSALAAVRKEIEARTASLKQSVVYQSSALRAATQQDFEVQSIYRKAVVIYRAAHPKVKRDPQPHVPSFRTKGKPVGTSAEALKQAVTDLATLKQAKLLLARTLMRLYEPHYLGYEFDLLGHKESLSVSAVADDQHAQFGRSRVVLSYKLSASSPRQGNFQLGQCNFDALNRPLRVRTNLKPVGKGHIDLVLR